MTYKSKTEQIRDYVALDILKGKLSYGDKLPEKKFFTSLFKVNPSYVDQAFKDLIIENLLENRDDGYFIKADEHHLMILKEEFLNEYINDFINNLEEAGISIEDAMRVLEIRNMANG
ncbi:GntR family transcriptional regulator [uncultured Anaerococcus sp.]|uniref:GntR family transcriptional regulator n=1 Tax=uncultured Anaerococcus sp. TaxID=293428 RepID=UPI00260BD551|nr:GntR family transcriptional regulator [uncultured Anaerococcus sp.]